MRTHLSVETEFPSTSKIIVESHGGHSNFHNSMASQVKPPQTSSRFTEFNIKTNEVISPYPIHTTEVSLKMGPGSQNKAQPAQRPSSQIYTPDRDWKFSHTVLTPHFEGKRDSIYSRKLLNESHLNTEHITQADPRRTVYAIVSPINYRNSGSANNYFSKNSHNDRPQDQKERKTEPGDRNLHLNNENLVQPSSENLKISNIIYPSNFTSRGFEVSKNQCHFVSNQYLKPETTPTSNHIEILKPLSSTTILQNSTIITQQTENKFKTFVLNPSIRNMSSLDLSQEPIRNQRTISKSPLTHVEAPGKSNFDNELLKPTNQTNPFYKEYPDVKIPRKNPAKSISKSPELNPLRNSENLNKILNSNVKGKQNEAHDSFKFPTITARECLNLYNPDNSKFTFPNHPRVYHDARKTEVIDKSHSPIRSPFENNGSNFKYSSFQNVQFNSSVTNANPQLGNVKEVQKVRSSPIPHYRESELFLEKGESSRIELSTKLKNPVVDRSRSPLVTPPHFYKSFTSSVDHQHEYENSFPRQNEDILDSPVQNQGFQDSKREYNNHYLKPSEDEKDVAISTPNIRDSLYFIGKAVPRDSIHLTNKNLHKNLISRMTQADDFKEPSTNTSLTSRSIQINSLLEISNVTSEASKRMINSTRSTNISQKSSYRHLHKSILKKPGNRENSIFFKKKKSVTFNEKGNSNYVIERYNHEEEGEIAKLTSSAIVANDSKELPKLYRPQVYITNSGRLIRQGAHRPELELEPKGPIRRIKIEDRIVNPRG
jgi:hypothetical protein